MAVQPEKNIGRIALKLPSGPGQTSIPYAMAAIVSGGEIIGYLPIKANDNSDGTASLDLTISSGVAEHHNGSATTTPATVNFSGTSKAILIQNRDSVNNLLVSFDGGTTTKTIDPNQSLSIEANHASVEVSSSAGTVAYEMLVTV